MYLVTAARNDVTSLNIRSLTGELVGVLGTGRISTATLSPDLGTLAVTSAPGDLTLMDLHNGRARQYQADPQQILDASWSPSGSRLAVTALDEEDLGQTFIALVDADTMELTRVTFGHAGERAPSWSPDGTFLAYESGADKGSQIAGIFLLGIDCVTVPSTCDGAATGPLNSDGETMAFSPSWSPDGRYLSAVCSGGVTGIDSTYLCIIRASDGHIDPIFPYPDTRISRWSPDGEWIAFERYGDTMIVRPNGKDERVLAEREELGFWLQFP